MVKSIFEKLNKSEDFVKLEVNVDSRMQEKSDLKSQTFMPIDTPELNSILTKIVSEKMCGKK